MGDRKLGSPTLGANGFGRGGDLPGGGYSKNFFGHGGDLPGGGYSKDYLGHGGDLPGGGYSKDYLGRGGFGAGREGSDENEVGVKRRRVAAPLPALNADTLSTLELESRLDNPGTGQLRISLKGTDGKPHTVKLNTAQMRDLQELMEANAATERALGHPRSKDELLANIIQKAHTEADLQKALNKQIEIEQAKRHLFENYPTDHAGRPKDLKYTLDHVALDEARPGYFKVAMKGENNLSGNKVTDDYQVTRHHANLFTTQKWSHQADASGKILTDRPAQYTGTSVDLGLKDYRYQETNLRYINVTEDRTADTARGNRTAAGMSMSVRSSSVTGHGASSGSYGAEEKKPALVKLADATNYNEANPFNRVLKATPHGVSFVDEIAQGLARAADGPEHITITNVGTKGGKLEGWTTRAPQEYIAEVTASNREWDIAYKKHGQSLNIRVTAEDVAKTGLAIQQEYRIKNGKNPTAEELRNGIIEHYNESFEVAQKHGGGLKQGLTETWSEKKQFVVNNRGSLPDALLPMLDREDPHVKKAASTRDATRMSSNSTGKNDKTADESTQIWSDGHHKDSMVKGYAINGSLREEMNIRPIQGPPAPAPKKTAEQKLNESIDMAMTTLPEVKKQEFDEAALLPTFAPTNTQQQPAASYTNNPFQAALTNANWTSGTKLGYDPGNPINAASKEKSLLALGGMSSESKGPGKVREQDNGLTA